MSCGSRLCHKGVTSVESGAKQQVVQAPSVSSVLYGTNVKMEKIQGPAGYTTFAEAGCKDENDLGVHTVDHQQTCAAMCDSEPTCVSFEWKYPQCQLSSSCTNPKHSSSGWITSIKDAGIPISGYKVHETGGCKGQNDLSIDTTSSLEECAAACQHNAQCVSFEYPKIGKKCQLSSTCTAPEGSSPKAKWRLYTKAPYHFEVTAVTGLHEDAGTYVVGIQFFVAGTWGETLDFISAKTVPGQVIKKKYNTFVRPTQLKFIHSDPDGWVVEAVTMTDDNNMTTVVRPIGSKELWVKDAEVTMDIPA